MRSYTYTILALSCVCLTILSCQTTSRQGLSPFPPDSSAKGQPPDETVVQSWLQYKAARGSHGSEACRQWTSLSEKKDFILLDLVELHRLFHCETDEAWGWDQYLLLVDREPWLKSLALQVLLRSAERRGQNLESALAYRELARIQPTKSSQEQFLTKSIAAAKSAGANTLVLGLEKELLALAPRLNSEAPTLERARDFRDVRDYASAARLYSDTARNSSELSQRLQALEGLRVTEKLRGRTQASILAAKQRRDELAALPWDPQRGADEVEATSVWARAVWTQGNSTLAERILEKALKRMGEGSSSAELVFLQGRIREEKEDFNRALTLYQKARALRPTEAWDWQQAWLTFKSGDTAKASELFGQGAQAYPDRARWQYWSLRSQQRVRGPLPAEAWRELETKDEFGYYGVLARRWSQRELPWSWSSPPVPTLDGGFFRNRNERALFEWLLSLQETDLAREYLRPLLTRARERRGAGSASQEGLHHLARTGSYLELFQFISTLSSQSRSQLVHQSPELVFPRAYLNFFEMAARESQVPQSLLLGIARQESAFNPFARSHADAVGIMQIVPNLSKPFRQSSKPADTLYDPETNVRFAAQHLRQLLRLYKGELIDAVSAYNANEKAVAQWRSRRSKLRLEACAQWQSEECTLAHEMWVEEIPYDETRNYVKLVLRNMSFYSERPGTFPGWQIED